jgi:hypothetical protein
LEVIYVLSTLENLLPASRQKIPDKAMASTVVPPFLCTTSYSFPLNPNYEKKEFCPNGNSVLKIEYKKRPDFSGLIHSYHNNF